MGRINKKGSIGSISGTVNDVVLSEWNDIPVVRSRAKRSNKPATTSQQVQQGKMAVAVKFAVAVKKVFAVGFQDFAVKMSAYNAGTRDLLFNGITGEAPNYSINYKRVLVCRGRLHTEANAAAKAATGQVTFTWTYEAAEDVVANDKAILVVYCEALGKSLITLKGANRSTGTASIAVARFKGYEVQTWLAFISPDGANTSPSIYTGAVTIS
jgi:hypothetical protein